MQFPKYPPKSHKSGQARIRWRTRDYYLGVHGTPESCREYERLKAAAKGIDSNDTLSATSGPTVAWVIAHFLEWCKANRAPRTAEWYEWRLGLFLAAAPTGLTVAQLRPWHLDDWFTRHPDWSPGTRHGAARAMQRAFRWATRQGRIDRSPLDGLEKQQPGKRTRVVSPAEFDTVLRSVRSQEFRDLIITTWETASRPQESLIVSARHVDLERARWVFPANEAKGERWPRIVYLNDVALEITRRLVLRHHEGPLFRNSQGRPWTPYAVNCAFCRAAKRSGVPKMCLYNLRHSWLDRALKNGVDALTAAILMGHRDPSMVAKVYQHLGHSPDYMLGQAKRATG